MKSRVAIVTSNNPVARPLNTSEIDIFIHSETMIGKSIPISLLLVANVFADIYDSCGNAGENCYGVPNGCISEKVHNHYLSLSLIKDLMLLINVRRIVQ